jgi:hypothetical protein
MLPWPASLLTEVLAHVLRHDANLLHRLYQLFLTDLQRFGPVPQLVGFMNVNPVRRSRRCCDADFPAACRRARPGRSDRMAGRHRRPCGARRGAGPVRSERLAPACPGLDAAR